ncbi:MAG: hypothetical protein K6D38_02200 [Pseudobutyrivibrio sp.]|nr:hypothetical protein [Pseudobutyrivibrio sp.]
MKKNVCFALSTAMLAMALVGCGQQAQVEEPETAPQEETQAAPVEGTTTENTEADDTTSKDVETVDTSALPEKYASIVEMAAKAAAGEYGDDLMELEDNGVCTEFGMVPGDTTVGYALKDLDGDGSDELLLGRNGTPGFDGWDGAVFNIYTLKDGEMMYVLANGGQRDSYFIAEDGTIGNVASGGATDTAYNYYKLDDKELKLIESVFTAPKEGSDEVNWYYTEKEPFTDLSNKISEKKYAEITGKYSAEAIEFTPFIQ